MSTALKNQLRAQLKARRLSLPDATRKRLSRAACEQFIANIPLQSTDIIAGYSPSQSQGELDISLLLEILEENGHTLCLPRITAANKALDFHQYNRNDSLIPNPKFPILEPSKHRKSLTPNILITPLLACDPDGFRLGYGGGFYDRTIQQLQVDERVNKRLLTIGICYDFQQIEQLPRQPHDEPLDIIVTDNQVTLCQ